MVHGYGEDPDHFDTHTGSRVVAALEHLRQGLRTHGLMRSCAACGTHGATFRAELGALLCDTCDDGASHGHL